MCSDGHCCLSGNVLGSGQRSLYLVRWGPEGWGGACRTVGTRVESLTSYTHLPVRKASGDLSSWSPNRRNLALSTFQPSNTLVTAQQKAAVSLSTVSCHARGAPQQPSMSDLGYVPASDNWQWTRAHSRKVVEFKNPRENFSSLYPWEAPGSSPCLLSHLYLEHTNRIVLINKCHANMAT